jgi:phytanoyl-CoA hydroxylase
MSILLLLSCFLIFSYEILADPKEYGRVSDFQYILTNEQIETFFRDGLVTIPNVLSEEEIMPIEEAFERFMNGSIQVPDKDLCDISKTFGTPREEWSIVNAMLPTKYDPQMQNNIYEILTKSMVDQLFPTENMTKDYDQFLNKLPGKADAVFAWHQDMAYWPGSTALGGINTTSTATFSLAIDDSSEENGCLRYVVGSGGGKDASKILRPHIPLVGTSREEGHALTVKVDETVEEVRLAPATRGSLTIHDEYVVHGSGGNLSPTRQRRTYVLAYRAGVIVEAERRLGFTHSHNDVVNWDTFLDGESHRVKVEATSTPKEEL